MADLNGFDAHTIDPETELGAVPAGKYLAMIVESEMKPTKNGDGQYLQLTFQIIDGQFNGRKVWARLNLLNASEQAMRIAKAELSAICRAVAVMKPKDSCELHDRPLLITIRQRKDKDSDEVTNEVRGFQSKDATTDKGKSASAPAWRR